MMANVIERHGDNVNKAIQYIDGELKHSTKSVQILISEAGARFNLSPKDEMFLMNFFKKQKQG